MAGSSAEQQAAVPGSGAVTFVVIAFNEESGIERTLDSIVAQEAGRDKRVIVVDDGSTDRTPSIVTGAGQRDQRIQLVRLVSNRGRGFARATGIDAAGDGMIATVDADIVLPPDWLARCLEAIRDVDAVAGTPVPDGDVAFLAAHFGLTPRVVGTTVALTGSNALYRAGVFQRVSYDQSLREGEDVALNHALEKLGLRGSVVPGLVVRHEESKSFPQTIAWMVQSGRGAARQFRRYRKLRTPDLVFCAFFGTLVVAVAPSLPARRARRGLPAALTLAAATAHVHRSFEFTIRQLPAFCGAVVADAAQLSAYFFGRLLGPPPIEHAEGADRNSESARDRACLIAHRSVGSVWCSRHRRRA